MYFIINKTDDHVTISDLKINGNSLSLAPRQAMDLDTFMQRSVIENSKDLSDAIKVGKIQLKQKTNKNQNIGKEEQENSSIDTDNIKDEIKEEIKKQMLTVLKEIKSSNSAPNDEVLNLLRQLKETINNKPNNVQNVETEQKTNQLDPKITGEIHARAVNKIVKQVDQGKVGFKEQQIKKSSNNDIDELDNLTK